MSTQNGTYKLNSSTLPRHVAIIMDGNGRWAKSRKLPRVEGHRAGGKTVRLVVEESRRLGIRYLTLFAFSTENWNRPKPEVAALMHLFKNYLESELDLMCQNNIRLRAIGDLERLPAAVQETLQSVSAKTASFDGMDLILAVSYGGREELTYAARRIALKVAQGELRADQINQGSIAEHLYAPDVPDPDLLIRTSDESRISNFLLWQLAYSEIIVTPVLWPDFKREEYKRCLDEYAGRKRRFGLTDEQLAESASEI